jgi:hypothetical protein
MISLMTGCRLVLILLFAAVVDLGSPVLPEMGEALGESQEAATLGRRRPPRLTRQATAVSPQLSVVSVRFAPPPATVRRQPAGPGATLVRKVPPPKLAAATDDH